MTKPRLFILDANALLHRAWHALPPLTNPEGKVVNAVYGVMMMVMKLLNEQKPDAFVACWDTKVPTFRHVAYEAYKAQREKQSDELYEQIPILYRGLKLLGVDSIEMDGYEADDLIGTMAMRAKKEGWDVTIVTGDRDALQLVQPGIAVLAFKKGVTDTVLYDEAEVKKQYGLTPDEFLVFKALRGDPSDNIPGVKGIGEKGATDLASRFHTVAGILKAAHDPSSEITAGVRGKLLAAEDELPQILKLVTIDKDVPHAWIPMQRPETLADEAGLITFLSAMGFKSLLKRIPGKQELSRQREAPRKEEKKKTKAPSEREDVLVQDVAGARSAVETLRCSGDVVVHIARGAAGSLFAQSVDGLVLGGDGKLFLFPVSLLAKEGKVMAVIAELLLDPAVPKVAHDAKGQMTALGSLGLHVETWRFDTMLAAYLLGAGERNHDLFSVTARYGVVPLSLDATPLREAEAVLSLVPVLAAALAQDHLSSILERFELPLIPILRAMERTGILIDSVYLERLAKEMRADKEALEKRMMKAAGREFNPASPSQLADVLFQDLKLPTQGIKRGKTAFSTASQELEKLRGSHPIIEMVEEHRELSKMLSTYVEVLPTLVDSHGRVHTTYNQAITATGRLSSTDPNLQNIPIRTEVGRKIRRAFIAEKGFILLSADYSQVELRLVAALAKDKRMLEAFQNGDDIHTATAAAIWKIPKNDVTKDQRRAAKAINFGLIYGQGPQGLSQSAGISFADAKKFIAAYFEAYPGIRQYMLETKALAMQLGYVETLFGRRRPLPEIQSMMPQVRSQAERMAINMPVQGTSADLIKLAMIELAKRLPSVSLSARMLLQVHDELVFEVREEEVKKVAAFVKDVMEHVEKVGVPIVVETKAGKNWEEMEKL